MPAFSLTASGVALLQLLEMPAHPRQHHVAVVDLAEDVLEVARPAARGVGGTAEGEAGHLEHVAKPLRRDPHVVLGLRLAVERPRREGEQLVEPHLDDPGGVLAEWARRVELLDRPGLHAAAASAPRTSSSMLSRSALRLLLGDQRRQVLVRLLLLAAELLDQGGDTAAIGRRHLIVEVVERGDRHVAVAPLPEGVGEPLHLASAPGHTAWRGSTARRSRAPPAGGAWPPACRGPARCRPCPARPGHARPAPRRAPRRPSRPPPRMASSAVEIGDWLRLGHRGR